MSTDTPTTHLKRNNDSTVCGIFFQVALHPIEVVELPEEATCLKCFKFSGAAYDFDIPPQPPQRADSELHMALLAWKNSDITMVQLKQYLHQHELQARIEELEELLPYTIHQPHKSLRSAAHARNHLRDRFKMVFEQRIAELQAQQQDKEAA